MVCIFKPACELLPPWTKELYLCTVAPPLYLLSDLLPPPPLPDVHYIETVCDCRWGVGCVEMYCGPHSAEVSLSVSEQIQNLQNCFTTPK
jgi:hypothetical protein